MAELEDLQGTQKLREAWPIIERNEQAINGDIINHKASGAAHAAESITYSGPVAGAANIKQAVDSHVQSEAAHAAEHIAYAGAVIGADNIKQAVDLEKQRVDTLVINGDSSAAAAEAAIDTEGVNHGTLNNRLGSDYTKLSTQLAENEKLANGVTSFTRSPFNAKADGVTNDTEAARACIEYAKANNLAIMIPYGTTLLESIDLTGLYVFGVGEHTKIKATSNAVDLITSGGNTFLENFFIDGSWDGVTAGQSGDVISIKNTETNTPFNIHLKRIKIRNAKQRFVYIERGGYSSIESCDFRAAGLHGIELYGPSGGEAVTTINIHGFTVSSDCPNGFGVRITNGNNIKLGAMIVEYTKGIELAGDDNRSISLDSVYQEFTIGTDFITPTGSGQGLSIANCFGGGKVIPYSPNWRDVYFSGNSSLAESAMPYNSRVIPADGEEKTTSTTGSFTAVSVSLPPGAWKVYGALQIQDASGGATVAELAGEITTNVSASGRNINTNADFNFGQACLSYSPPAQANLRVNPFKFVINTADSNLTVYLRGYINRTSGTIAYKGQLYAEKLT